MKVALLLVVSLAALAYAGPATKNNQIGSSDHTNQFNKQQQQQQQYMTSGDAKQTEAVEQLKQWCFSSQMSQPELTASFKKLVSVVKSQPEDQATQTAVMNERICQGALVQKSQKGETLGAQGADAQAHELIKDVYMDALFACQSAQCKQQLVKIIDSQDEKIDSIRAAYYMTSIAVTEDGSINENEIKPLIDSLIKTTTASKSDSSASSEAVERQKLFATTALIAKALKQQSSAESKKTTSQVKESAKEVAKLINDRYIRPVNQQEVQQYKQQSAQEQSQTVAKKIARRNAALKALANIPGWIIKETPEVEQAVSEIAQNKQELNIARQSAIECLEENESANSMLKQITFDQEEPMEVRVAAVRALMTSTFAGKEQTDDKKQQVASETVEQVLKHCENQKNQQNDTQFVLYAISYLNNLRTSQQPEMQAIKECIASNKQHYMQIQLLNKKFQQQLSEVTKASRNYKFEQEFNQIESGLVIEGDMVYASKQHRQSEFNVLPKLIRVNMSMPVMGETVNVVELTLRQNSMDEELLSAFKLASSASFTGSETVSKVVDSFKSSVASSSSSSGKKQDQTVEADLSIKVDGVTIVYVSVDDFKSNSHHQNKQHKRSTDSFLDDIIEQLKQKPIAFNRGFNFNINERLAKVLDVDANVMAGLRFESRASGQSSDEFEIQTQIEPRFAFEAIVGPAKMSQKKLMQRFSTKTAVGLRLRFKQNELLDVQVDLPMNTMELFTVETQLVEKSASVAHSYTYLPESMYGPEDIYSLSSDRFYNNDLYYTERDSSAPRSAYKRSIFQRDSNTKKIAKFIAGKRAFAHSLETPEELARATGLRGKLRVVASPKDMSFLAQAVCEKYEPSMQGYRVKVEKVDRNRDQQQYIVSVSTPGARTDRTMQVRVASQWTNQRKLVKAEVQLPKKTVSVVYELVKDQRQYAIKTQIAQTSNNNSRNQQWRHSFECGIQRNSPVGSSRIATTYKPYLSVESSALSRPVQLEGVVSYQRTPKTVISYELKCSTSGDFVQGKIILDQRQTSYSNQKRSSSSRSLKSPIEIIFDREDVTMTGDMTAQIQEHSIKAHRMLDWSASKKSLVSESYVSYKNARKQQKDCQIVSTLKLNKEQQQYTIERKSPQEERKEFRLVLDSQLKPQIKQHQMVAELRYNGKSQPSIAAYKHKIELAQMDLKQNKAELVYSVEVSASEQRLNEKYTGRTLVDLSRKSKTVKSELSSRNKSAKIDVEFVSLNQHQIELVYQGEQLQHKCQVLADERQLMVESRTEKRGQTLAKVSIKASKQTPIDCEIVVDVPAKNIKCVADLEFASGKTSSVAIKTPRYASKAEFSFDSINNKYNRKSQHQHWTSSISSPWNSISNLRFKSDLKDSMSQENYWIDSQLNKMDKSFLRYNSPIYRTDVEYDPRESSAKFGAFRRSKRSISGSIYNNDDSLLNEPFSYNDEDSSYNNNNKLSLGNNMWYMRSVIGAAPKELRRALFEYADSRQQHKHRLNWSPRDQRLNFNLNRQPMIDSDDSYPSIRVQGDLATNNWYNKNQIQKPSTLKMQSQIGDFDFVASPFDGEQAYAKMSALSRHPRSAYKKHESEYTFSKKHGHKASMKHIDAKNKRHQLTFEADREPQKWTKMAFESDKHGKADYQHQWRRHLTKRSLLDQSMRSRYNSASNDNDDDDMVYANKLAFSSSSPSYTHDTSMSWVEPERMVYGQRYRRDLTSSGASRRFDSLDYLKHCAGRLQSQTGSPSDADQLYKLDFDFEPNSYNTRLSLAHAKDMLHESSYEYEPTQRTYKLHSKYSNLLTKQPSYEFLATSMRPMVENLATANQEPVFIDEHHPMLEQPISQRLASKLFRQPLKLDYSDKYGRVARLDYDQFAGAASNYNGLRQKRAAFYYKDDSFDFDHQSTADFYPEILLGQVKPSYKKQQQQHHTAGDFSVKSQTKYGPIIVSANADDSNANLQIESPIIRLKLTTEEAKRGVQLIKVQVDNKQQGVKLAKILRQNAPLLADCPVIEDFVAKFDKCQFEHETELLLSYVDSIMKLKSSTQMDKRTTLIVDGEYNKQQEKAYFKIDGPHTKGQLIVDLNKQTAHLVLATNDKRGLNHETRVQRTSDKFFSVESQTSYKQQPLYKLSAKVSSEILREPEHLFASRRSSYSSSSKFARDEKHVSSFDAVIYHPKQYQMTGQYDCQKKEAEVVVRDVEKRETSEIRVVYDDQAENVYVQARSASPRGIVKQMNKTFNVAPLIKAY